MKEIIYIEPSSLAKIMGVITLGITALCILPIEFFYIKQMAVAHRFYWGFILVWFFLIIYPVFAYIVGLIIAYLYNFSAKRIGGLEIVDKS